MAMILIVCYSHTCSLITSYFMEIENNFLAKLFNLTYSTDGTLPITIEIVAFFKRPD